MENKNTPACSCKCSKLEPYHQIEYCPLHAATPDLLAALDMLCLSIHLETGLRSDSEIYQSIQKQFGEAMAEAWRNARAAIAKAKGE